MKTPDTPENDDSFQDEEDLFKSFADAVDDEDVEAQEEAMLKVWQHIAEQPVEESPWLKAMGEAHQCEAAFDWTEAEDAYKRAIEVTKEQPLLQGRAFAQLAALFGLVGLDELAFEATQAATRANREGGISSLVAFQLQSEARFYLKDGELSQAWAKVHEAFEFVEEGAMHDLERAHALVLRAECYGREGQVKKAEEDLESAWKLLEPHGGTFFAAGWQGGLAQWWTAKAQLHALQDEWQDAVDCWEQVVERRRIIAQLPQLEGPYKHNSLAKSLIEIGRALQRLGDDSASAYLQESDSIRRLIGLPPFEEATQMEP